MTTKWLLDPVGEGDPEFDYGLTKLEILQMLAEDLGYMIEPVAARMVAEHHRHRLQNAVNWAARGSVVEFQPGFKSYVIGHARPELKALDDGATLEEMEVKS